MKRAWWGGPVVALGTVLAGLAVSYVISPHGGAQLTILLLAVLLTAWAGGLLAGLWATVLAVFGAVLLPFAVTLPTPSSAPNLFVSLTVFAVVGASISALADRQRPPAHFRISWISCLGELGRKHSSGRSRPPQAAKYRTGLGRL